MILQFNLSESLNQSIRFTKSRKLILRIYLFDCLEEEVTVVHNVSLDEEFTHEARSHLEMALSKLRFLLLIIELNARALVDILLREEIYASVTLDRMSRELALACSCNSTRESRL